MLEGEVREMHTVGTAIRRLRQRQNLTQDALAERLHVTRQAVSSWEMGRTQPDVGMLAELAAALGTDVNELIYGRSAEAAYAKGRRSRIVVAAVCGAAVLAWLAAEGLMRPLFHAWNEHYVITPLLWWIFTARSAGVLAAGALIPALPSVWRDLRVRNLRLRRALLGAGLALLAADTCIWAAAQVLPRLEPIRDGLAWVLWRVGFAGHYGCMALSGALLYLGYNR